tara:strand:+ start:26 stop:1006 length:981 start_codon:yes stop_codon:yes gene_type:complete
MRNVVNFNDLFKRINVLEEATYKSIVKKGLTPTINAYVDPQGNTVTAKSRLKNLIMIRAMYNLNLISDAESAQLNRKSTSSTKIINFLVEKDPDFFNGDKGKELEEYIEANSAEMVGFHIENDSRGTFTKQEVQEIEDIGVEDIGDDISQDISGDLDKFELLQVNGLMNKVLSDIRKNLGEEGFDISDEALDEVEDFSETNIKTFDNLKNFIKQISNEPGYEKIAAYLSTIIKSVKTVGLEDEEHKKPDDDGDGVPDWADEKPGEDDHAEDEETVTESYTAQYLTEQPTTTKKAKPLSTIQESVSFKDKLKPKTSWQLEELRRYGL